MGSPNDAGLAGQYLEPIQGVLKYCGVSDIKTCVNWGIYPGADEARVSGALNAIDAFASEFGKE